MQLNIADFLVKLEAEAQTMPKAREMVNAEIQKYAGMRQVLENAESDKAFTQTLLANLDNYLAVLSSIQKKLNYSFLALFKAVPDEDPLINQKVIELLRKLNSKEESLL